MRRVSCPNLAVNMKPSMAINANCRKVIKFPDPGSNLVGRKRDVEMNSENTGEGLVHHLYPIGDSLD